MLIHMRHELMTHDSWVYTQWNVKHFRSLAVFKLPDSATYFLSHWERILDKDFLPLGEDIVRWMQHVDPTYETYETYETCGSKPGSRKIPLLLCWSNLSFIGNMNPRRMRRATSGVSETILPFGDIYFTLVDVGGQRSERRKWWQNHLIFLFRPNIKAAWKKLWIHPFQ